MPELDQPKSNECNGVLDTNNNSLFGVWNDYGTLKEVAVGTAEGIVIPRMLPAYCEGPSNDLIEKLKHFAGQPAENLPELSEFLAEAQQQLDYLAEVYKKHGVIVHRPRPYTNEELRYESELQVGALRMFPADPLWVIGRNIIECQFRQPYRNKERFPLRELIAKQSLENFDVRIHTCPVTSPFNPESSRDDANRQRDYILEGGDILICGNEGKDILVGVDNYRSSSAHGVEWMRRQLLDDGYRVTPVPISLGAPVHLLGAMGVCGQESALIYRPALTDGIPEPIKHWDLIDITLEEARAGGPCTVMLDQKTILVTAETPRLIDLLEKRGLTVIPIPFSAIIKFDGAIRCATFVMRRDKL